MIDPKLAQAQYEKAAPTKAPAKPKTPKPELLLPFAAHSLAGESRIESSTIHNMCAQDEDFADLQVSKSVFAKRAFKMAV